MLVQSAANRPTGHFEVQGDDRTGDADPCSVEARQGPQCGRRHRDRQQPSNASQHDAAERGAADGGSGDRAAQRRCYDQTASRLRYIKHLRSEYQRSPRTQADANHTRAKTEKIQFELAEKRPELVRVYEVNEMIDGLCGVVLTALGSMPARCAPRCDLATRRNIERVVFEVRTELAKVCQQMADKSGEPPLDEQD
jgi:hypothetical protein